MVFIKVCGITNLEDALAAVEAGADALGFNFYRRSPRYVEPASVREIVEQVPSEILCVGVFVNEESASVRQVVAESGVGAAQLHGDESPAYCDDLTGLRVIKALRVNDEFTPEQATAYRAEAILLDSFSAGMRGGTGRTFDWSVARRTRQLVPKLYLAGGLTPGNVHEAIHTVEPYAVDVCSGIESRPGRKSLGLMKDFFAAACPDEEKA
ncbi:MAG: phosphoribosylanthranilate isomerase [Pyrinomonadaceae bacterium]